MSQVKVGDLLRARLKRTITSPDGERVFYHDEEEIFLRVVEVKPDGGLRCVVTDEVPRGDIQ